MKKKINYTHLINLKITEQQFADLQEIKRNSGKSFSSLVRENISFYLSYYKSKT